MTSNRVSALDKLSLDDRAIVNILTSIQARHRNHEELARTVIASDPSRKSFEQDSEKGIPCRWKIGFFNLETAARASLYPI